MKSKPSNNVPKEAVIPASAPTMGTPLHNYGLLHEH